mgnify:CR=1
MTPVKVLTVVDSLRTLTCVSECEVLPTRYKIVLFLEFPAALILPLSLIFKPLTPMSAKTYLK